MDDQNEDEINEIKEQQEAFKIFDFNHDGKLNTEEAYWAFLSLGCEFSEEEVSSIINQYGKDGCLDFDSFSNFLLKRSKDSEIEEQIMECFTEMDKDHDGKIGKKDLKYLLYSIGEKLTDEEIEEIINQTDTTKEGFIHYKDMIRLLLSK
jgi:Ca2+-binding EF-hand superfamily protein